MSREERGPLVARFANRPESLGAVRADQVMPTSRTKCPSLRLSAPPPAQCMMNASKMMARIMTATQKKNTMMPGMAYPATALVLATATSYPPPPDLFGGCLAGTTMRARVAAGGGALRLDHDLAGRLVRFLVA